MEPETVANIGLLCAVVAPVLHAIFLLYINKILGISRKTLGPELAATAASLSLGFMIADHASDLLFLDILVWLSCMIVCMASFVIILKKTRSGAGNQFTNERGRIRLSSVLGFACLAVVVLLRLWILGVV